MGIHPPINTTKNECSHSTLVCNRGYAPRKCNMFSDDIPFWRDYVSANLVDGPSRMFHEAFDGPTRTISITASMTLFFSIPITISNVPSAFFLVPTLRKLVKASHEPDDSRLMPRRNQVGKYDTKSIVMICCGSLCGMEEDQSLVH
ncbi:hypothetical protein OCU04_000664 [Sclerotinia nivalis]|uniref:Uncharacterized protein n=1 Tax=Sclerotinia nivalis TaxID=352851 RepID=A0A9X0AWJ5_9HELO|nr:hypothetical protein OCU04_000664 [Sclerotinia nivalis]